MDRDLSSPAQEMSESLGLATAAGDVVVPTSAPGAYRQLMARWQKDGRLGSSFGNAKTALTKFLCSAEKSLDDTIGDEMYARFGDLVDEHIKASGLKRGAARSRRWHLKRIQAEIKKDHEGSKLPHSGTFAEAFKIHLAGSGLKLAVVARQVGAPRHTLSSWKAGRKSPRRTSLKVIERLETVLKIAPGTLTGLVFQGPTSSTLKTGISRSGKKQQERAKDVYRLHFRDWPAAAKAEFGQFVGYKTIPVTNSLCTRPPEGGYRTDRDEVASKEFHMGCWEGLFGFVINKRKEWREQKRTNPQENGENVCPDSEYSLEDLHLALLCIPELLGEYLEFCKERSLGNCHSGGSKALLDLAKSMVRPKTGFLWDRWKRDGALPLFRHLLPTTEKDVYGRESRLETLESQWKYFCATTHEKLADLSKRVKKSMEFGTSRDPKENIVDLLALERPMEPLFEMEKQMWNQPMPRASEEFVAYEYCKRIMVSLLIRHLFRGKTFSEMRLGDLQDRGSTMDLNLSPKRFKTARFLDQNYVMTIDPVLYPMLRKYLKEYRHILAQDCQEPYLFFTCPSRGHKPGDRRKFTTRLSTAVRSFSQQYLGHLCPSGFGCQSVRHLAATDIILRDPVNGFAEAAIALWDSEDTVRKAYAHIENTRFSRSHRQRNSLQSKLPTFTSKTSHLEFDQKPSVVR